MVGVELGNTATVFASFRWCDFTLSLGVVKQFSASDLFRISFELNLFVAIMILAYAAFPVRVIFAFVIIFPVNNSAANFSSKASLTIRAAIF